MVRGVARVDENQPDIVDALRKCGCLVEVLSRLGKGVPDLLVGTPRGRLILLEVKDGSKPPSERRLTADQQQWHQRWRRHSIFVVESVRDALIAIDHDCTSFDFDKRGRRSCTGCGRELPGGTDLESA